MASPFDTIVAPITGSGASPVAIVRLSGPQAWEVAKSLSTGRAAVDRPRFAQYLTFSTGDEGYLILFEAGKSYTGEESAELSIHGSRASVNAMLEAAKALGARPAEPGEFTQRAFMNGRIDLTEAEGVRDTIEAETEAQLRLANVMRDGELHQVVRKLSDDLVGVLAAIEASVDFSEEIGEIDPVDLGGRIQAVINSLSDLLATAYTGRIMREGLRIAIVGPPNAGKSSLLNRLLGSERSIVTEIAGTTRDYVEERVDFDGYPVVLIDTAGLRETDDLVESIGVQKSRAIAADADLIWYVADSREVNERFTSEFERPVIRIANKIDLSKPPGNWIGISCMTGEGLDSLIESAKAQFDNPLGLAIQLRHQPELESAVDELQVAREVLDYQRPPDLAAVGLRSAIQALGRITGETADADMIARIFRDFCIGK